MIIAPLRTSVFQEGDDLAAFIKKYIKRLPNRSIIAITSKIVALAEHRVAVAKTAKEKEQLIRAESDYALRTRFGWLTIKNGTPLMSAGIDKSDTQHKYILLPKNSFETARALRAKLRRAYRVKELGSSYY